MSTSYPVQTLREALNVLRPDHALDYATQRNIFIERNSYALRFVEIELETDSYSQILFSGSRGSGKSSELSKLEDKQQFWITKFSVLEKLNIHDITHLDLIFTTVAEMLKKALSSELKIDGQLQKDISRLGDSIVFETESQEGAGVSVEAGINIPKIVTLSGRLAKEENTRKIIRKKLENSLSEIEVMLATLAEAVQIQLGKIPVIVIEDVDKVSLDEAEELFHRNGNVLAGLPINIVFTFPSALQYEQCYTQIKNIFSYVAVLENFKTHSRDGQPCEESLQTLEKMVSKRVAPELFQEGVLRELAAKSGGVPRILLRLTKDSVMKALLEGSAQVKLEHVSDIVRQERIDFSKVLSDHQLSLLKKVAATKELDSGVHDNLTLLHNLSVIDYINGIAWYDVAPVIEPLLATKEHV